MESVNQCQIGNFYCCDLTVSSAAFPDNISSPAYLGIQPLIILHTVHCEM